jgi:hypothetical protein
MQRISPTRIDRCIRTSLPAIRTARDVGPTAENVTQAKRRGEITPERGETMMRIRELPSDRKSRVRTPHRAIEA